VLVELVVPVEQKQLAAEQSLPSLFGLALLCLDGQHQGRKFVFVMGVLEIEGQLAQELKHHLHC